MTTQTLHRQIRFLDVARAFAILASNADKALDLAVEVDDDQIRVIENNLHDITRRMNGDPIAAEIEVLLSHPFHTSPTTSPAADVQADEFKWTKTGARGAKDVHFDCSFRGMKLSVVKHGPSNYEGLIDGQHVLRGKFKANVREKIEKEAAKRANA